MCGASICAGHDPDQQERWEVLQSFTSHAWIDGPLVEPGTILMRVTDYEAEVRELQRRIWSVEDGVVGPYHAELERERDELRAELDTYHRRFGRIAALAREPLDPSAWANETCYYDDEGKLRSK